MKKIRYQLFITLLILSILTLQVIGKTTIEVENEMAIGYGDFDGEYIYFITASSSDKMIYFELCMVNQNNELSKTILHYEYNDTIGLLGYPFLANLPGSDDIMIYLSILTDEKVTALVIRYGDSTVSAIHTSGDLNDSAKFFTIQDQLYLAHQNGDTYVIDKYNSDTNELQTIFDLRNEMAYSGHLSSKELIQYNDLIIIEGSYYVKESDNYYEYTKVFELNFVDDTYSIPYEYQTNDSVIALTASEDLISMVVMSDIDDNPQYIIREIVSAEGEYSIYDHVITDNTYKIEFINNGVKQDRNYLISSEGGLAHIYIRDGDLLVYWSLQDLENSKITWIATHDIIGGLGLYSDMDKTVSFYFFDLWDPIELDIFDISTIEYTDNGFTEPAFLPISLGVTLIAIMLSAILYRKNNTKRISNFRLLF